VPRRGGAHAHPSGWGRPVGAGYRSGMSWFGKLTGALRRDRRMRERGEVDAPTDPAHGTRETGGGKQEYVGRGGADETGTGGQDVPDDQGAGRDA
jgi:hypothetical protein